MSKQSGDSGDLSPPPVTPVTPPPVTAQRSVLLPVQRSVSLPAQVPLGRAQILEALDSLVITSDREYNSDDDKDDIAEVNASGLHFDYDSNSRDDPEEDPLSTDNDEEDPVKMILVILLTQDSGDCHLLYL